MSNNESFNHEYLNIEHNLKYEYVEVKTTNEWINEYPHFVIGYNIITYKSYRYDSVSNKEYDHKEWEIDFSDNLDYITSFNKFVNEIANLLFNAKFNENNIRIFPQYYMSIKLGMYDDNESKVLSDCLTSQYDNYDKIENYVNNFIGKWTHHKNILQPRKE